MPLSAWAAPYAAMVMDARSGQILFEQNADTRLHPASLTKMMTLYIAFDAIERGEISLDTKVKISRHAANEPPSKLGLRAGQSLALRYLIRAAAVKSANDAATAIGEAISGSEAEFAKRMTRTARALGMKNSTFKNANGLTESGHLSTAHDMTLLGRRLFYDFPEYYNIFSRRSTDASIAQVRNTNRRFLDAYKGADGIKTGFTNAAGFNLVASAERGNTRIIATVFGGTSTAQRNAKVASLLDVGFAKAPARAKEAPPAMVDLSKLGVMTVADAGAPKRAALPLPRPAQPAPATLSPEVLAAIQIDVAEALERVNATSEPLAAQSPQADPGIVVATADIPVPRPRPTAPDTEAGAIVIAETEPVDAAAEQAEVLVELAAVVPAQTPPTPVLILDRPTTDDTTTFATPEVVTRLASAEGDVWGISLGKFNSPYEAEKIMMRVALTEPATLTGALRQVVKRKTGFEATFLSMTRDAADMACRRLQARNTTCVTVSP
ncbi:MAG: serine hydrolase [Paracoccaceae bacterium]|jgi:D-alanyl-D-alanine carboxypeptidase|nr:serine hydrolase [Paracoccaceae bacterium]